MPAAWPAATIRSARRGDARAIAAVHVASWQASYRGQLPDDYLASRSVAVRTGQWDAILADPGARHTLVAEVDGYVVGFAQAGPSGDTDAPPSTGELLTIYLHPDVWGRGLGRELQEEALRCLTRDGYTEATLWMLSTNDRARRFYLRQGWSPVEGERIQEFGGRVVVDHRFRRVLAGRPVPEEPE